MTPQGRTFALLTIFLFSSLLFITWPPGEGRACCSDLESADYLSLSEKDLVREINLLRANPAQYASYLEQSKKYYVGKNYQPQGQGLRLQTIEGMGAVDEAIRVLGATSPLPPLSLSKGMSLAAKDHVKDLGLTGRTGHRGTDGSSTEARVNRYGSFANGIGENIVYQSESAREVVMGWLIDDGVATRGHRRNLLSTNYSFVGVAIGERTSSGSMCVLTFAGGYSELPAEPAGNRTTARKL